jgi:phytoene/squalene synthetase
MTPQQYVQQKAAASGSSFYYAFLFLPAPRRAAITAFYAFCREVDDVVDEVSDPAWPAPSWPGGRPKWPRPLPASPSTR